MYFKNTILYLKKILCIVVIFNNNVYNNIKENCTLKSTQAT